MAVRKYSFIVGADTLTPSTITRGGVQGEHNATQIIFKMDYGLINSLKELAAEGRTFHYRFDGYDGAGGKSSTEPKEFVPGDISIDTEFSYSLEHRQTKYGGTIQIFFVITLMENESTELELYSYTVKMTLKSLPNGKDVAPEEYESISTLAVATKHNAEKAADASQAAIEAQGKTEDARAALEGYTEWVFDGGDASSSVGVEFVVDKQMSDTSSNIVQNRAIKAYVDDKKEDTDNKISDINNSLTEANNKITEVSNGLTQIKTDMVDYIVEQGTNGIWTYRKWNSGIAECWGRYETVLEAGWITWGSLYGKPVINADSIEYPVTFIKAPVEMVNGEVKGCAAWVMRETTVNSDSCKYVDAYTMVRATDVSISASVVVDIYTIGKWKE